MPTRRTASEITDDQLSALYDLLAARYPVADMAAFVATFDVAMAQPKQRHRAGLVGYYTPEETKVAEIQIGWSFRRAARGHQVDRESRFGLHLAVDGSHPASDVDNLAKTVMDGLNKVCWHDDRQVDELHVRRLPGAGPRTEITVYRLVEA